MDNTPTTQTRHRLGSRAGQLSALKVGEHAFFEVPSGTTPTVMQQRILVDARRAGIKITQLRWVAVAPSSLDALDLIRVTRLS